MPNLKGVYTDSEEFSSRAASLAKRFDLPIVTDLTALSGEAVVLVVLSAGIGFWRPAKKEKSLVLNFNSRKLAELITPKSQAKSLLLKSLGKSRSLNVFDATAGFGRDAYQIAAYGHSLVMCEQNEIIATLLQDALERAASNSICEKMELRIGSSEVVMEEALNRGEQYDVVYLDPMFPSQKSRALVKKEQQILRSIVEPGPEGLLVPALKLAKNRVVVKRFKTSEFYSGKIPGQSVRGKTNRYDIYFC